ncbi:hypothetical protein ACTNCZ_14895, partial [Segatella copri]|uniref:hypothetical protein n=1 Tax=Segatella copri TaxID=165179 RepID=UPI003F8ABE33
RKYFEKTKDKVLTIRNIRRHFGCYGFSDNLSLFSQRGLHFLPKPLFLRKRGCNRPPVLGTATL